MSSDGKDLPGEFKHVDLNGDYAIDDKDRCIIGDPNPDFTASLNLAFRQQESRRSVFSTVCSATTSSITVIPTIRA